MTTTGERRFNTDNLEVVVPAPTPLLDKGDYELVIKAQEIRKADKPGAIPYVSVTAEALNTALTEGGKNRKVWFNILLGTKPGKDGVMNPQRANGLVALSKAVNTPCDAGLVSQVIDGETVEYINPQEVNQWVQSLDGMTFRARVRTSKATGEYKEKNEIERFLPQGE